MIMHKHKLVLASGIVWTGAGLLLLSFVVRWTNVLTTKQLMWALGIGIPIGLIKSKIFWAVSKKNIKRIMNLPERVGIWRFQTWTSYLLIAFMMGFGITMRTTGWIHKKYLAPVYVGIGLALFISSFIYYIEYYKLATQNVPA